MTPCSPRHRRHCSTAHAALVWDYRAERQRLESEAEERSYGYPSELADWLADHPLLTFRQWLVHTRGRSA